MICFHCKNCGQKISVQDQFSGRRGKCPKCRAILTIPQPPAGDTGADLGSNANEPKGSLENTPYNLTLLDVPQEIKDRSQPTEQPDSSEAVYEQFRRSQGGLTTQQSDQIPQRKLPWIIDIFLYPISKPGLTTLGIIIGIPLLLKLIIMLLGAFTLVFPPMLILLAVVAFARFIIDIVLGLYMYWYMCECIRDSAAGELRAPETIGNTPGLGEMFFQTLRIIGCFIFFIAPVLFYSQYAQKADFIFWSLMAYAVLFFPMGLLAVVVFDSISGLNPVLLLGSIFSTFFQYCGLVILFYGLGILLFIITSVIQQSWILAYISGIVFIYLLLVAAHLLGRFFWKYQEKLNWEV